ncbi:putative restriction endonuclease [Kineococcus radiotolerans]|uniref:Putative restriction endonuclease n=1 Tax=Kineococcus radiotolerans TaxID=131568 RepID=A0A7W4XWU0_KINRA|nr:YDG/SRA domain-containing protein [Kineococcus radiotolerans]MBB2900480.1 putative restriction endonuclease [Kineococcus radiotolerans]
MAGTPTGEDRGDLILYTGHGGQDGRKQQVRNQDLDDSGNAGLVRSEMDGLPVRVIRGFGHGGPHAPSTGYRYDGLYRVDKHYPARHQGFRVWMFRMTKIVDDVAGSPIVVPAPLAKLLKVGTDGPVPTVTTTVQRLVRNSQVTQAVKELHHHICQFCSVQTLVSNGVGYSEGAHIRALGKPHHGPDILSNVLSLCANCHVRFDKGGLVLTDSLAIIDTNTKQRIGQVKPHPAHGIDVQHVTYHRGLWAK